jgi:uncharacterized protein
MKTKLLLLTLLLTILVVGVSAQEYPTLTGYVTDNAGILTVSERAALSERIGAIERNTSVQIAILDVENTNGEDLSQYAAKVGTNNGVGQKETDNGIVILVSFDNQRGIHIATGKGIEGILPDIKTNRIYESGKPYFTNKQYYWGYSVMLDGIESALKTEDPSTTATQQIDVQPLDPMSTTIFIVVVLIFSIGFLIYVKQSNNDDDSCVTFDPPYSQSEERRNRMSESLAAAAAMTTVSSAAHRMRRRAADEDDDSSSHHFSGYSSYSRSHNDSGGGGGFSGFGGGGFGGGGAGGSF